MTDRITRATDEESNVDEHTLSEPATSSVSRGAQVSLIFFHREGAQVVPLVEERPIVVGRASDATLVIPESSISRHHCEFRLLQNGSVSVKDLGSTNGTKLDGKTIREAVLGPDNEVTLGAVTVQLHSRHRGTLLPAGLISHDRFMALLEHEAVRAKAFNESLGLLFVQVPPTHAAELRRCCPRFRALVGPADLMAMYSPHCIELAVLRNADKMQTLTEQIIACVTEESKDAGKKVSCGVSVLPSRATTAEALIATAQEALHLASPDDGAVRTAPLLSGEFAAVKTKKPSDKGLVLPLVISPRMKELHVSVGRVAKGEMPILVVGETGTGKEVLARTIHMQSNRHSNPFHAVNCGAIPPSLMESVLFGHVKGAFTGANQDSMGLVEAANRGTLFLDEIGELSLAGQAALLRFLETKRIVRVGASREQRVDVRVVAATNRNLEQMCEEKLFRIDLYYRLNTVVLEIPPLRDRRDEIVPLAEYFVQQFVPATDRRVMKIGEDSKRVLMAYSWPGNVRQLRNVIERAVYLATGDNITINDLPDSLRSLQETAPPRSQRDSTADDLDVTDVRMEFREKIEQVEAKLILEALRANNWNQTKTAAQLQIPPRTLTRKIKAYGIMKLGYGIRDDADEKE